MRPAQAKSRVESHPATRTILALAAVLTGVIALFELLKIAGVKL